MTKHKSAFDIGWVKGINDGEHIIDTMMDNLDDNPSVAGKADLRSRVESMLREFLLDEVLSEKEKRSLYQEFGWADQELVSVITFLGTQITTLDSILEDLGRGFGRIAKVVSNYQSDLIMAAPTAWEAYPELFEVKTKKLDSLIKDLMPTSKVLDYGANMKEILNQLRGRLIGTHQYVRGNALSLKSGYIRGVGDADVMTKAIHINNQSRTKVFGINLSDKINTLMGNFLQDEVFTEAELQEMGEEFEWANEEMTAAAEVTSGYTKVIGLAVEDFSRAYGRLLYMLNNFDSAIEGIAPTAYSAYPQLFSSAINKMQKLTDSIISTSEVKAYAIQLQEIFDELTSHIDETHKGLLDALVRAMEQHEYKFSKRDMAYIENVLAG